MPKIDPTGPIPLSFALGGVLSFGAGCGLSPPWEMAMLVIAPVSAVFGALAGGLAAHSWKGAAGSVFIMVFGTLGMAQLAHSNPPWVIEQSENAVTAAVALATLLGIALRKLRPASGGGPPPVTS